MEKNQRVSLAETSTRDVVAACEQNYIDYWKCIGRSSNAEYSDDAGISRCVTGLSQEIFNVVLRSRLAQTELDSKIDAMVDEFRTRKLHLIWHVGVLTEPADLGRHLEARGFPRDYDLTAMAIDLENPKQPPYSPENAIVRSVAGEGDCVRWIDCLTRSWESPRTVAPWMTANACFNTLIEGTMNLNLPRKMFLGILEGIPVSASMLFWSKDIAGIQAVGTVLEGRGRGVGGATVDAALGDARKMGFKFAVVLSTVEGVGMYRKLGFTTYGKLPEHSMDFRDDKSC